MKKNLIKVNFSNGTQKEYIADDFSFDTEKHTSLFAFNISEPGYKRIYIPYHNVLDISVEDKYE